MDILDKIIHEREIILEDYNKLEEMRKGVELLEEKLRAYGSREEIIKDIEDLKALKEPVQQIEQPIEEETIYSEQPIEEELQEELVQE